MVKQPNFLYLFQKQQKNKTPDFQRPRLGFAPLHFLVFTCPLLLSCQHPNCLHIADISFDHKNISYLVKIIPRVRLAKAHTPQKAHQKETPRLSLFPFFITLLVSTGRVGRGFHFVYTFPFFLPAAFHSCGVSVWYGR